MRVPWVLLCACGRLGFGEQPEPDAEPPLAGPCDVRVTSDTVALYTFEGDLGADETHQHDAVGSGTYAPTAEGACGAGAVRFEMGHLVAADSPAWDLDAGAIDLFFTVDTPSIGKDQGLVSRDASGQAYDGHISIGLSASGQAFVRLQRAGTKIVYRCTSGPVPANRWLHLATSFGPQGFRMWMNGVEVDGTTFTTTAVSSCTEPHVYGMAGNDNPLVIGAFNWSAPNNDPMPPIIRPITGAIDQVRIRSTWIDFTE